MENPVIDRSFINEFNTDSNLSFASNASADAGDNATESGTSTPARSQKKKAARKKGELETLGIVTSNLQGAADDLATDVVFPAENLFEYQWPQEKGAEHWMLQEQVSEFLGVSSFKRKHPEIVRRNVDVLERDHLRENGVVTEMQCDLGLTALRSAEVMDLMAVDYVDKYEEYVKVLHEREKQSMKNQRLEYKIPQVDKGELKRFTRKAMRSCSEFNSMFQRERREERCAYFDMQTMNIHYPKQRYKVLPPEMTKPGLYPVALLPGQYQNYYKKFNTEELKYLPIGTVMHHPPRIVGSKWQDPSLVEKYSDDEEDQMVSDDNGSEDGKSGSEVEESPKSSGKKSLKRKLDNSIEFDPPPKEPCDICKKRAIGFGPLPNGQRVSKKMAGMRELLSCTVCKKRAHPWCWEMTIQMAKVVKNYDWQCMECKTCVTCSDPNDEEKMMFCDLCDRGYHSFCVGLSDIPLGKWECPRCNEAAVAAADAAASAVVSDEDDQNSPPARPLTGRGSRGPRRPRGGRPPRGEGRGRGTPRGSRRASKTGTPRGSSRGLTRGVRGQTPRGRGSRGGRVSTPRGRGRGRGRPRSSAAAAMSSDALDDLQAAIDAVAAGGTANDEEVDDGANESNSAEEMESSGEDRTPPPVPVSLIRVNAVAGEEEEEEAGAPDEREPGSEPEPEDVEGGDEEELEEEDMEEVGDVQDDEEEPMEDPEEADEEVN